MKTYADSVLAPLDGEEAAAAVRAAIAAVTADGSVSQDRTRIYGPQLRIEKPPRRDADPVRLVWVRIRDVDRKVVHEVSVREGSVAELTLNPNASPAFTDAEYEDARRLLTDESSLGGLLAEDDVEIEWFNPAHGPARLLGARVVRVRAHEVIADITTATVDLDDGTVLEAGGTR